MANKSLIIVESPGKIKTLSRFLGDAYIIEASKGHVVDLPESRIGVDVDRGFAPAYTVVKDREDVIKKLQSAAKHADMIFLAPDPDREGEAISWHLAHLLNIDPLSNCRITFNSITREEVLKSINSPRPINLNLVSAQQSRRILDRLVGYKLSPLLWKKVRMGLSAGRVQSVAVLLICDREKEIMAFKPEEFWTVKALLQTDKRQKFEARLTKIDGKKAVIPDNQAADRIREETSSAPFTVSSVAKRERKQTPPPPFITSTLQQEAAQKFSFTPKRTMTIAQKLYEGIELGSEGHVGLITYMRTDSVRVAPEGLNEATDYVEKRFGNDYTLKAPRLYKSRKGAQDAHEAIRPTSIWHTPEKLNKSLSPEELKLYTLIWRRFVATQMAEAIFDVVTIEVKSGRNTLQAVGTTLKFDGFTSLYSEAPDETVEEVSTPDEEQNEKLPAFDKQRLPPLTEGEILKLEKLDCKQNFTQPPARYSDTSLIKTLEKEGIGRPSTYASIVDTIQQRGYVKKIEGRFHPSDSAFLATDILTASFKDVINTSFTATMENLLDEVEDGQKDWLKILTDFYQPFLADLKKADATLKKAEIGSDCFCPKCNKPMMVKLGRSGKFLACSGYPECKTTENIPDEILLFAAIQQQTPLKLREILDKAKENEGPPPEISDQVCTLCKAPMVLKTSRFGKFLACSRYPDCKGARPLTQGTGIACPRPNCGGQIIIKRSKKRRIFYGCGNYPTCNLVTWSMPTGALCPTCQAPLVKHSTKKLGDFVKCSNKECDYKILSQEEGKTSGEKA